MINLIQSFAIKHFEGILKKMSPVFQQEFITMLMVVVHSHRHNKDDSFISEVNIDFSLVRDTMYKYSKKAQERFFSYPVFAFLYIWFASSKEGMEFTKEKFTNKGEDYLDKMKVEIEDLKRESFGALKKNGPQTQVASSMQKMANGGHSVSNM
jgi:hypothetical protein